MVIFFPVGNRVLASSIIYEISTAVFRWLFPHASGAAVEVFYIVFRKSLHFLEYGILAHLLYRAVPGTRPPEMGHALGAPGGDGLRRLRLP